MAHTTNTTNTTNTPRTPAVPLSTLPSALPIDTLPPNPTILQLPEIRSQIPTLLRNPSQQTFTAEPPPVWRDFLSLTSSLRTFHGRDVVEVWRDCCARSGTAVDWDSLKVEGGAVQRLVVGMGWVDLDVSFFAGSDGGDGDGDLERDGDDGGRRGGGKGLRRECKGIVSVVPGEKEGEWRVWMIRTWLDGFEGCGDVDVMEAREYLEDADGVDGSTDGVVDAKEHGKAGVEEVSTVIIGAGQNGLSVAGKLQALGLSYVLLEKNDEVGGNWKGRYDYMKWNTPKEFNNLPFDRTFKPDDPDRLSAAHVAEGYQRYVKKYGINIRLSTTLTASTFDPTSKTWTLQTTHHPTSKTHTIKSHHLILATAQGHSTPHYPRYLDRPLYTGCVHHALADYKNAKPWAGQRGIVVGTANTGMDIALDMVEHGLREVTLVQRGRTLVLKGEWAFGAMSPLYNTHIPTHQADRLGFTFPLPHIRTITNAYMHNLVLTHSAWYSALESSGLKCDRPGDLIANLNERFGGYYFDFGACERILDGSIKVKSDSAVRGWSKDGLVFEDGSQVEGEVVVFATGFDGNAAGDVGKLLGEEVRGKLDGYWGVDGEGEVRGVWKPSGHPNLLLQGGDTRQARWFSRFVALQIQADVLGCPMQPYTRFAPVKM